MLFECFYYPMLISNNKLVKCYDNLIKFNFGDPVPTKTLYYNYSENFIIYHGDEFFKVENGVLVGSINHTDIQFPTNIVFNKGTQLTVLSAKELKSIRLILKGEFELEKELGNLFFLYNSIITKIKHTQYDTLSILTNSSRDFIFINDELDINTKKLINDLTTIKDKIYDLITENPHLEESYLNYMQFSNEENLLNLSIYKYFVKNSDEYKNYSFKKLNSKSKNTCPKLKFDAMIKSCGINCDRIS
jgi:hypothetical protein